MKTAKQTERKKERRLELIIFMGKFGQTLRPMSSYIILKQAF